ncbi:signal transduction family protein [Desulfotignum phosphitoxidans DSM 13687]|uniref:Signal transduction family protein n=2 Tax=Desulfotignum phosphitoxidans TaxID=190898 RepID=S0FUQ5_9BACT|nr:signal transduction family protein [Desulfotignum phosphitoxidans DSM 13687]
METNLNQHAYLSIRPTLLIIISALVLMTSSIIGYYYFNFGQKAAKQLASNVIDSNQLSISRELKNTLAKSHAINRMNAEYINTNLINFRNLTEFKIPFLNIVKSFDMIRAVAFGSEFGDFIGVGKRSQEVFNFTIADKTKDKNYYVYLADKHGTLKSLEQTVENYFPQNRSWYKSAIEAKGPSWSPVYIWASQTNIGISAVLPVYNESETKGVLMSALTLDSISDYLRTFKKIYSEQIYIIDRSGMLIATSTAEPLIINDKNGKSTKLERVKAKEVTNILIQQSTDYLLRRFSDFKQITINLNETIKIEKENYILNVFPFALEGGIDWLGVIVTPVEKILAPVKASMQTTIWASLFILMCALSIGFFVTRFITRPIINLNKDITAFIPGKWGTIKNDSRFKEVYQLTASYNSMTRLLNEAFDSLEQKVEQRTIELSRTNEDLIVQIKERRQIEQEKEKLISQLQKSLQQVKKLSGLLPICAHCKKIRDDKGYWNQIESYICERSEADFSHGICPECAKKLYPDFDIYDD